MEHVIHYARSLSHRKRTIRRSIHSLGKRTMVSKRRVSKTPKTTAMPSRGPLRDYLMQQDSSLAEAANHTWTIASAIHDRQTKKAGNVDGRKHVEQVEMNVWRLLSETFEQPAGTPCNLERFTTRDLYLLSCAACCHDFDKGLHNEVLEGNFKHGEGSGKFLFENWEKLGIVGRAHAEWIDWIVSIHDCRLDFDSRLQQLPDHPGLPPLRCLATLLKAADTLHMDESRISRLAVPDDSLKGFDRLKQLARGNVLGWGVDGRHIVITVSVKDEETAGALATSIQHIRNTEWPPIERNLQAFRFPYFLDFQWTHPVHLGPELVDMTYSAQRKANIEFGAIASEALEPATKTSDIVTPSEPLRIIAVAPDDLGPYLCEMGYLSVIDNTYVMPQLQDQGANVGAIGRIFVGPANCGKTRVAYEWIKEKIGLNLSSWVVLRPESGTIPESSGRFELDWKARYGDRRRRPSRAILFVDDLPNYLPPPGNGPAAAEAVHRLLVWFRNCGTIQERCFVGTIRTEQMLDKPDWPDRLLELDHDLRILRVESLDETKMRQLWQGMSSARADQSDGMGALNLEVSDEFLAAVAGRRTDPETVSYFARTMAVRGKKRLTAEEAERFSEDVIRIWLNETWPAIHDAYGIAASVFYTLARLLEPRAQLKSRFKASLNPEWEYHAIYGPALLAASNGNPSEYVPAITHMLSDGHASGIKGEWIRPKFDFLLQAEALDEVMVTLPTAEWFASHARNLTPRGQVSMSYLLCSGAYPLVREGVTHHWLFGHVMGQLSNKTAAPDKQSTESQLLLLQEFVRQAHGDTTLFVREEIVWALIMQAKLLMDVDRGEDATKALTESLKHLDDDMHATVRQGVASGIAHEISVLRGLMHHEDALRTCEELIHHFSNDQDPSVREDVAHGLFSKGLILTDQPGRNEDALTACEELMKRFGDDTTPGIREVVARGLLLQETLLSRMQRNEDALTACEELMKRFGDDTSPGIREVAARGLDLQALLLSLAGRNEDAVKAYEEMLKRFGDDMSPGIRDLVAEGLYLKALLLPLLGRNEDAVKAHEEVLKRFGDDTSPGIRRSVAQTLLQKANVLGRLGRHEDALKACEELLKRFGDDTNSVIRESVAKSLLEKAAILGRLGRHEDALKPCEELVKRFGDDTTPSIREMVGNGLFLQASVLDFLQRDEDAFEAYEELVKSFGNDTTPGARVSVAKSMVRQAVVLGRLARVADGLRTCEEMVRGFASDTTPGIRESVAMAFHTKSLLLVMDWRKTGTPSLLSMAVAAEHESVASGGKTYNLACALALDGQVSEALESLEKSLRDGEMKWSDVEADQDWAHVRSHPRYVELKAEYGGESRVDPTCGGDNALS